MSKDQISCRCPTLPSQTQDYDQPCLIGLQRGIWHLHSLHTVLRVQIPYLEQSIFATGDQMAGVCQEGEIRHLVLVSTQSVQTRLCPHRTRASHTIDI